MEMVSEMMISIFGAFAQAESESINKNVTIGKRYRYKEGIVSFNYKNFLGYHKGADGNPEINPEEAATIKKIYQMFLDGSNLDIIKAELEENKIKTPMRKDFWSKEVLKSILTNVRYKGDALLQKTYISDCISKKIKKITANFHNIMCSTIILRSSPPEIFDQVQVEMARRVSERKVSERLLFLSDIKYVTLAWVISDLNTKKLNQTERRVARMSIIEAIINSTDIAKLLRELSAFLDKCGSTSEVSDTFCNELIWAIDGKIEGLALDDNKNESTYFVLDTADSPLFLLYSYLHGIATLIIHFCYKLIK